ncbi:MAG: LysM peptidoglycan-binding domain-containing protein, partial [Planctomycetes bacterium]|nr:LysM peptidoglycan-binding domain-containing protein [Planctomycetota bacterium]
MKRRLHSVAACLFLLSPPDIIPDGHRGVKVQTILDLGPLADSTCLQYEIEKGDTLEAIARTRLGSAERVGDIVARNPTLTPERLQVGQKLWLPPKQAAVKAPSYLFLEVPFSGPIAPISAPVRRQVEPLTMPGEVPFSRYGSYVLHVVPEQHLLAFTAAIRERRKPGEPILAGAAGESITKVMGRG